MKALVLGFLLGSLLALCDRSHGFTREHPGSRAIDTSYFLPRNTTIPYNYFIHLKTHVHNNDPVFQGKTEIYFEIIEPTQEIVMHLQDLDIQSTELSRIPESMGVPIAIDNPEYSINTVTELVTFHSAASLPVGKYILKVEYTGTMRNYQSGYFISSYRDASDKVHYVGSSHFQATLARRVFPCFDEPDLKATFTLWITHHESYNAVSNMDINTLYDDSEYPNYRLTQFRTTPRMSTYLLAFAVTDFSTKSADRQQVLVRPDGLTQVDVTLEAGTKILAALDAHTGVRYHDYMPSLRHIAIPDRGTGAMENWGLITYGEPAVLFDPKQNSYRTYKRVITVVAHELAHQWFGNLVSPKWWEYIWLNEGFAQLYQYYAASLVYPELGYWDLFNVEVVHRALEQDAKEDTRAMNTPAASQDEVHALFDIIAYQKSGSVLNMFRTVLGDENWKAALHSYIDSHKLNSATPDDLYDALQAAAENKGVIPDAYTIRQLMQSWADAAGYPVLHVRRIYSNGQVLLSQERFLEDKRLPNSHIWHIPFNYIDRNPRKDIAERNGFYWLTSKAAMLLTKTPEDQWIIFNRNQFGYYRVNYDKHNWNLITETLLSNPLAIPTANRAQLIDDAFHLARAEYLDMAYALKLLTYLRNEVEYAPWAAADRVLNYFHGKLQGTAHYARFAQFVDDIVSEVYETLQIDNVTGQESALDKHLKQTITSWACRAGNQDCLDKTHTALTEEKSEESAVHPDIMATVYCYGLQNGSYPQLSHLVPKLSQSSNEAYRAELITALGCTKDPRSVESLLSIIQLPFISFLSTEKSQLVNALVAGTDSDGIGTIFQFLMKANNAKNFMNSVGEGTFRAMIVNIAKRLNTEAEQSMLRQLINSLGDLIPAETSQAAHAAMKANIDWFSSLEGLVTVEFFQLYSSNSV